VIKSRSSTIDGAPTVEVRVWPSAASQLTWLAACGIGVRINWQHRDLVVPVADLAP
jgi:hypothetical protein